MFESDCDTPLQLNPKIQTRITLEDGRILIKLRAVEGTSYWSYIVWIGKQRHTQSNFSSDSEALYYAMLVVWKHRQ